MSTAEKMNVLKSEADKISEAASSLELEIGSALFNDEHGNAPSDADVDNLVSTAKGIAAKIKASIDVIEAL